MDFIGWPSANFCSLEHTPKPHTLTELTVLALFRIRGPKLQDHLVAWDGINYVHALVNKINSL